MVDGAVVKPPRHICCLSPQLCVGSLRSIIGAGMANDTKNSIEMALQPLIGLPLSIAREAADMRVLHFGAIRPHRSGKGTVGSHALHIQCAWRLTGPGGIITGYSDCVSSSEPDGEPDPENWRSGNLLKVRMEEFMGDYDENTRSPIDLTGRHVVAAVEADRYGSVDILFNGDIRLQIFPDGSSTEDWRFISMKPEGRDHFVIFGGKVETQDEHP